LRCIRDHNAVAAQAEFGQPGALAESRGIVALAILTFVVAGDGHAPCSEAGAADRRYLVAPLTYRERQAFHADLAREGGI
jgi:hypothetical protein